MVALTTQAIIAQKMQLDEAAHIEGRSLWTDARRRLFRNKAAVTSMIFLGIIVFLAIFADLLSPHSFEELDWDNMKVAPTMDNCYHALNLGNGSWAEILGAVTGATGNGTNGDLLLDAATFNFGGGVTVGLGALPFPAIANS